MGLKRFIKDAVENEIVSTIPVSFVKRTTVDLEHGVVDFDYVRHQRVVIMFIHALNPERDCIVVVPYNP
jgi:hypothetical protein